MPFSCYSYPSDVPAGFPDRSPAQAARRDLRRMPNTCFRY